MSPEKVPLVEKHLHEWVSDMCLCYKGICMNEAGKGALFEKHLHEWGDTQDVAEKHLYQWEKYHKNGEEIDDELLPYKEKITCLTFFNPIYTRYSHVTFIG